MFFCVLQWDVAVKFNGAGRRGTAPHHNCVVGGAKRAEHPTKLAAAQPGGHLTAVEMQTADDRRRASDVHLGP